MSNCRSIFDNLIRVEYFRVGGDSISFAQPFTVLKPIVTVGDASSTGKDCKVSKTADFVSAIDDMSASLSADSSTSVAGTKFKVNVEYDIYWGDDEAQKELWNKHLIEIQRNAYHLRVTYMYGAQHIVRCDGKAWSFSYKESKGKLHISINIENVSGAQRVVE